MKKIALVLFSAAVSFISVFDLAAQGKYGADSAECIKYLSYYKEYYKQKNYDDALPNWRKAYELCPPTANQTMIIDGTSLMRYLINKNRNNAIYKEALIDTLMQLHDTRAQYYPKYASTALNNKGLDMINYVQDDPDFMYEGAKEIISKNKTNTKPQIFIFLVKSSCDLYQKGTNTADQVIEDYETSMEYVEEIEAKNPSKTITKMKGDIENLFVASKIASCENLINLFTPRYEADPENLDLAKNIVRMMSTTENCTDNELFINAATTMHRLEPSYTSAYFLFKLYSTQKNIDEAVKYIEEAIAYPESDNATDAQYYYELSTFCFMNGNNAKAYEAALKAAELDESITGKAYMVCGTIWGSMACPGNEIEKRAQYWVAVDYMVKAKKADPSLESEADNYISTYSVYYPETAEAFMYNITDGDSYTVSCNGMRANTTVRTRK